MDTFTAELILLAGVWGFLAWQNPRRAFLALPILLPTYVIRGQIGPIPTTALELIILVTFGIWFVKEGWLSAYTRARAWRGPVLLFLIAGFVAIFVSPETLKALGLYRAYIIEPLLIFYMGLGIVKTEEDKNELTQHLALITIMLGIWAFIQYVTGWGIPEPWQALEARRSTGPFPYPNALALFVTPVTAYLFANRLRETTTRYASSLLIWSGVLAGLLAIIFAKSDGGLIALGAAVFIALAMHRKTRLLATALIFAALIALTQIPGLEERVTETISFNEWSGQVRLVMWEETLTMLRDRPIFGAGLSAYPTVIAPYHQADWMEIFQYPHNILLNLWSELGLMGILAFAWILIRWIQCSINKNDLNIQTLDLTLPVLMAILIHGLVDVPYFKNDLAVVFWLLVLLTTQLQTKKL